VGTHHSKCLHPNNENALKNPAMEMIATFASVGRLDPVCADTGLNIRANQHGIDNGWFNWPFNFDPAWLLSCDGFKQK
jgi:hypothetical protein